MAWDGMTNKLALRAGRAWISGSAMGRDVDGYNG